MLETAITGTIPASQVAVIVYASDTSTIMWFGGHNTEGVALRPLITGGGFDTWIETEPLFVGVGFGLRVEDTTEAELEIETPSGVAQTMVTTKVNCAVAPFSMDAVVQLRVPAVPGAGVAHDQPAGAATEVNVVPGGRVSVKATLAAAS